LCFSVESNQVGMKIKGFLFDVDGVLYDSMPLHEQAWRRAFLDVGIKIKRTDIYYIEGMPSPKTALRLAALAKQKLTKQQFNHIIRRKRELYSSFSNPKLIKGAKQLIRHLQKNGYKIGLVTGTTQSKTMKRIKQDFNISPNKIISGQETKNSKPHPEPFLQGLKKLQLKPDQAIVIENAPLGIRSAKSAKIKCVAITTGPIAKKDLKREGADWIFKDSAEVLKNFHKIVTQ